MVDVVLNPVTGTETLSTRGLLDSGCTSSAINRSFVEKHQLETRKISVPIPVYNADGTRNAGGDITEYVETRMTIKGHAERIDLAITNLGKKDIYLGHDWLKRHNPSVNWKTQSILFGRCACAGNTFSLPDSDPDDKWDEELEEGDTILAVTNGRRGRNPRRTSCQRPSSRRKRGKAEENVRRDRYRRSTDPSATCSPRRTSTKCQSGPHGTMP